MTASNAAVNTPLLCFLVCTYHREDLVERCLRSIAQMEGIGAGDCEIVVSDNSDAGTAAQVVGQLAAELPIPIRYVQAHPANIAVARNTGVRATQARFVAMIDDDMTVAGDWLVQARTALQELPYDVFSGPVVPSYEQPELATPFSDAFFHREMPVSGPIPLRIMGPDRTRGYIPATSNSIFRRDRCLCDAEVFNEHYGKSGGEDVDLFCRLESRGRTFAWLPGIRTTELVPARRCELSYLEKRSFVGGQIFASTYIRNSASPAWTSLKVAAIARLQLLLLLPRRLLSHGLPVALQLKQSAVRGKLAWRHMMPIYAQEKTSS